MNDDELDLDGDGVADVMVPGLGARPLPTNEMSSTSPYEAVAEAQMPPESNPYSPMGQIDHMGYALRSQTDAVELIGRVDSALLQLLADDVVGDRPAPEPQQEQAEQHQADDPDDEQRNRAAKAMPPHDDRVVRHAFATLAFACLHRHPFLNPAGRSPFRGRHEPGLASGVTISGFPRHG